MLAAPTGWRLPDTLQPDATCGYQPINGGYSVSLGANCTGSELGNLFYNVPGSIAYNSIETTNNSNYDLFSAIQPNFYWSATEYRPVADYVWILSLGSGVQCATSITNTRYAWAVQTGDVGDVPVPAAVWLFASGLMGLISIARLKAWA